jgi:hypothetical protein
LKQFSSSEEITKGGKKEKNEETKQKKIKKERLHQL